MRIVLQASGFMPENNNKLDSNSGVSQLSEHSTNFDFKNEWKNSFGQKTTPPSDSKTSLKRFIRRVRFYNRIFLFIWFFIFKVILKLSSEENDMGFKIRGGFENSLGIFISHVTKNSSADFVGLKVNKKKFNK